MKQDCDDYELIIVNDHSIDNTEKICRRYQNENPAKISYYNNIKNKKGVSSARNYAISKSNSKYLMFIDSDDYYNTDMLSVMSKEIINNDLTVCGFKRVNKKTKNERNKFIDEIICDNKIDIIKIIEKLQEEDLFNQLWNKIFKSEIIKKNNIEFLEEISLGEDYRFILDYIEHIKRIKIIDKILYTYNSDENGLALKYNDENTKIKLDNILYHKKIYEKNEIADTYYIDRFYILTVLSGFASIVSNNNSKEAKKIIKKYIDYRDIQENINEIYIKCNSIKLKSIIKLLRLRNVNYIYYLGKIMNVAKKIYKRIKIA